MDMYFKLQWKRFARFLPGAVCVVLILLVGLLFAFTQMTSTASADENNVKLKIGICGDVDDPIMQMGLGAITALDTSRYSLEVVILEEEEANSLLEERKISAYMVVPEGFMDAAFRGQMIPLKMVTTTASASIVSIFKDEVTAVVAGMVINAEKGVFGMMDGFDQYDIPYQQDLVDGLTFQYVDYILCRGDVYELEELGIADELRFSTYLLCGLSVLLVLLACLPFAPLMIRQDPALERMLEAKGKSLRKQYIYQFLAYLLGIVAIFAVLMILALVGIAAFRPEELEYFPVFDIILNGLPVVVMAASMSYMLYSLASDLISGVLLQFFTTVAMCFVSGCMYPVFFFPVEVQRLAAMLPSGVARTQLAGIFTGAFAWDSFGVLLGFSVVFCLIGGTVRAWAAKNGGR